MFWAHGHPSNIYLVNCSSGTIQDQFPFKDTRELIAYALARGLISLDLPSKSHNTN